MSVSVLVYLKGISLVSLTLLLFGLFFWTAVGASLDKTEAGDLLLWYNEYDTNGNLGRNHIVLWRKKPRKNQP